MCVVIPAAYWKATLSIIESKSFLYCFISLEAILFSFSRSTFAVNPGCQIRHIFFMISLFSFMGLELKLESFQSHHNQHSFQQIIIRFRHTASFINHHLRSVFCGKIFATFFLKRKKKREILG